MTQKERMLAGQLYLVDEELAAENRRTAGVLRQFNSEPEPEARAALLRGLLGGTGRTFRIEPPFRCDYGSHIYLGENFYANYELIVLDQCDVRFGDNVMLGPRVSLFSAGHPLDADIRNAGLEYGKPITVGSNVWMGGCVTVNGGVTIGDNVVIGSGSVVTHDIPSNVIAAGNPCRVLRPLTDADRAHWQQEAARWRAECGGEARSPRGWTAVPGLCRRVRARGHRRGPRLSRHFAAAERAGRVRPRLGAARAAAPPRHGKCPALRRGGPHALFPRRRPRCHRPERGRHHRLRRDGRRSHCADSGPLPLGARPALYLDLTAAVLRQRPAPQAGRMGFTIEQERLVRDGGFLYQAMAARFGSAAPVTPGQEYVSAALLRSGDPLLPDYFDRLIPSLERTVEGLRRGSEPERLHYYETALRELREMRELYDNGC